MQTPMMVPPFQLALALPTTTSLVLNELVDSLRTISGSPRVTYLGTGLSSSPSVKRALRTSASELLQGKRRAMSGGRPRLRSPRAKVRPMTGRLLHNRLPLAAGPLTRTGGAHGTHGTRTALVVLHGGSQAAVRGTELTDRRCSTFFSALAV